MRFGRLEGERSGLGLIDAGSCPWLNFLIAGSRDNKRVFSVSLFK